VRSRGYAPENCTWISRSENIKRGILAGPRGAGWGITAFGETKTAADPPCATGGQGLLDRLGRGMSVERAITLPKFAERRAARSSRLRRPQGGRVRIDWKKARDVHVKKGLSVSDTALVLDASYHGVLRGLRQRGWLQARDATPPTKLRHGRLLHKVWQNMRERCWSKAHPAYEHVGGHGIGVCDSWDEFGAFHA
jgi:hypothetical protein